MIKKKKRIIGEINRREFKGGGSESRHSSFEEMENSSTFKKSSLISHHARAANDVRIYRKFKLLITSLLFTQTLNDITFKIQGINCIDHHRLQKTAILDRFLTNQFRNISSNYYNSGKIFHKHENDNHNRLDEGSNKRFSHSIKRSLQNHSENIKDSMKINDINERLKRDNSQPTHGLYVELQSEVGDKRSIDISRYGEIRVPMTKNRGRKERSFLSKDKLFVNQGKQKLIQPISSSPTGGRYVANLKRHYLPNGPPPFKPSTLMLGTLSGGALEKFKRTSIFKQMYRSKAYYLFLDVLSQLNLIADNISKKKMDLAQVQMEAIQTIMNKLTPKFGHNLKTKWPLVMLNPQFFRELVSSPTFLVMLFHAVEVAHMSMPGNLLLKPLVQLIAQPSPEKEEKIWWRRKRLYDTLNGRGSSELQPNLKTIHFRNPGEQTPIAIPKIVNIFRKLTNRPSPDPTTHKQHFIYPSSSIPQPVSSVLDLKGNQIHDNDLYMNAAQEDAFLANQLKTNYQINQNQPQDEESMDDWQTQFAKGTSLNQAIVKPEFYDQMALGNQEEWLTYRPHPEQLMSKQEFDSLDPQDKERMMQEVRDRFEESKWTNELIRQHSEFIEAFTNRPGNPTSEPEAHNSIENSQITIAGEGNGE